MMWATVLLEQPEGGNRKRGKYAFGQLPSAGDRIEITSDRQHIDLLLVKYVQHTPAPSTDLRDLDEWDRRHSNVSDGTIWIAPTAPIVRIVCELLAEI
jgi:hypothetical protein